MNKWQKEVTQSHLNDETAVVRDLKRVYDQARKDCQERIEALNSRKDLQNLQSIIYQKQYQQALKDQLDGICDALNADQFATVSEYLAKTYQSGYVGTMYDLHKQGIPIITPIRQDQVVKAVQLDSKISKGLYAKMGEDVAGLKKSIRSELSRGISNGSSWLDIAGNIANGMNSPFNKALNRTVLIARTEGHRIQQEAAWEAQKSAKEKGANVVKQWCATLDDKTRETHQQLDGKIVEVDEPFTLPGGLSAMFPGDFGDPAEDCNCRCQALQRAKWALDEDELETLQKRAEFFELDKTKDFEEFKEKYLVASEATQNDDNAGIISDVLEQPVKSTDPQCDSLLTALDSRAVTYNPVHNNATLLSGDEIISTLAGGDKTGGSCASVALAYIGQQQGWDVRDFRGGDSRTFFSSTVNLWKLSNIDGLKTLKADGKCSATVGNRLLKQVEAGKEYYLCVGRHAAIVRQSGEGALQYLELQSPKRSGWQNFGDSPRNMLCTRFGCSSTSDYGNSAYYNFMINITDSNFATDDFKSLLGYINTAESEQRKGEYGTIK